MNQQLIITRGLPGSGKSTWAKAWVLEDPKTRIRVNRDDIRRMLGPYWVPEREGLVTTLENLMVKNSLSNSYSVVVDATNFKDYRWDSVAITNGHRPIIKDFTDVPVEECIRRDLLRVESVGEEVIMRMYNKYLKNE